jgi:hypothetical protein
LIKQSPVRIIAIIILTAVGLMITASLIMEQDTRAPTGVRRAPPLVVGDNVYGAWWSNNTANGNNEVLFRYLLMAVRVSQIRSISAIQMIQNQREWN